ncbi:MAG: NAD(P)H-dependent glycerol-3-phosphate dehydrogenase [Candidatus Limimorpha sp.]
MKKIVIIGSGAIATAIGDVIAEKNQDDVTMLSVEPEVIEMVNNQHINTSYFPKFRLDEHLKATSDKRVLENADIIFFAIPSVAIVGYLKENQRYITPSSILVNLAKGFANEDQIIPDCVSSFLGNKIVTLKGPSFAREIINRQDTGLTAASSDTALYDVIKDVFECTNIRIDFTTDVTGVEYASLLKNIYAIVIGIVDANFDSANLRSIVITKAINEMRDILTSFGGDENTMFKYCGFGDFSLTALNDMSRNRTLGLLIGKGFFNSGISEKVVLEGRIAVDVMHRKLENNNMDFNDFPLMDELYHVLNDNDYMTTNFVKNILKRI